MAANAAVIPSSPHRFLKVVRARSPQERLGSSSVSGAWGAVYGQCASSLERRRADVPLSESQKLDVVCDDRILWVHRERPFELGQGTRPVTSQRVGIAEVI